MPILAIDQGSSSTKALVVGPDQDVLSIAEIPLQPTLRPEGGVELDPDALLVSVREAGRRAVAAARAPIEAVGVANPGASVLAWDRSSGRPLSPVIARHDQRSAAVCAQLTDAGYGADLMRITGLPLDPQFAGPKLAWLRGRLGPGGVFTTVDSWLLHQLSGAFVTDTSTASQTMLLDLDRLQWSAEAARWFGLRADDLPVIVESASPIGITRAFGTATPIPITGLSAGPPAALLAHGCLQAGQSTCRYGTGATLLVNAGPGAKRSTAGLAASVAWRIAGTASYGLDGQVYPVGDAMRWLHEIGLIGDTADLDSLRGSVPDTGGVIAVPALAGLGAPYWRPAATGLLTGLRLSSTRGHLIRAVVEGIAAQLALLAGAAARDLDARLTTLRVDGPLTRSKLFMQEQADLLQIPLEVSAEPNATALGVAALARIGIGHAKTPADAVGEWEPEERFEPRIRHDQAAQRLELWRRTAERHLSTEG